MALRRAEKERQEFEARRAKENAAIIAIGAFIREHVGDDLPELLALIAHYLPAAAILVLASRRGERFSNAISRPSTP